MLKEGNIFKNMNLEQKREGKTLKRYIFSNFFRVFQLTIN